MRILKKLKPVTEEQSATVNMLPHLASCCLPCSCKQWEKVTLHVLKTGYCLSNRKTFSLEWLGEFSTVMQTLDFVSGLHNCLEFSQPLSCLYQAMQIQEKSFLLLL